MVALIGASGSGKSTLLRHMAGLVAADRRPDGCRVEVLGALVQQHGQLARGLTDVRTVTPDADRLAESDPHRALWMTNPDLCCRIRKAEPLQRALTGFDAWFTGRKRFQTNARAALALFEADGHRIKVNPLADWTESEVWDYINQRQIPYNPLHDAGYPSIGCTHCTRPPGADGGARSGRWADAHKTECGLHG